MNNDYNFKVHTTGDIIDLKGRVIGHINLEYIKRIAERPQGDLAETLKDRIEESVCKYCKMNDHCELCEISRVFMIIDLTDKELKENDNG